MTIKQAADIVGVAPEWVRAGIISGYFPVGIATRNGKQVTDVQEMHGKGRITYVIFEDKFKEVTGWTGTGT